MKIKHYSRENYEMTKRYCGQTKDPDRQQRLEAGGRTLLIFGLSPEVYSDINTLNNLRRGFVSNTKKSR